MSIWMSGVVTRTCRSTTFGKSSHCLSKLTTTSAKHEVDRSRRLDRRKGVGVATLVGDENPGAAEKPFSSIENERGNEQEGSHPRTLGPQGIVETSVLVSQAYHESATARHRQMLLKFQQTAKAGESGSIVASTSAAAQHRRKRLDQFEEDRKSLKTNPSSFRIPISAEALNELDWTPLNPIEINSRSEGKEEVPDKQKNSTWVPALVIGGLAGTAGILFVNSGMYV